MCGLTTVNCSELVKVINHGEELRDIRALIYGIRRLNWMYAALILLGDEESRISNTNSYIIHEYRLQ